MFAIAVLLAGAGLLVLCRLVFLVGVYALPVLIALGLGAWLRAHGAGAAQTIAWCALAAIAVVVAGHYALAKARSPTARTAIAMAFAAPAGFAGYHLAHGLVSGAHLPQPWGLLACLAASALMVAASWARLARPVTPPR